MKQYLSTPTGIIRPPINFTTISRSCQRCKMRPVKQETKKETARGLFLVGRPARGGAVACRRAGRGRGRPSTLAGGRLSAVGLSVSLSVVACFVVPRVGRLSAVGRGLFLFHCTTKSPLQGVHPVGLSIHETGTDAKQRGGCFGSVVYFSGVVAFFAGCFALFFFACSRSRFACSRFFSCSFLRCSCRRAFSSC